MSFGLENYVDYGNYNRLRSLFRRLEALRCGAESGNMTSLCIAVDLENALAKVTTDMECSCIWNCLVEGKSYSSYAKNINKSEGYIIKAIDIGIIKIAYYLETGKTISNNEAKAELIRLEELGSW